MKTFTIESRKLLTVNNDPQRRCYDGCHASTTQEWSPWEWIELEVPEDKLDERLHFWKSLNDYAVNQRGTAAIKEFRVVTP